MTIKTKVLTLSILTVLISAFAITTINVINIKQLSQDNIYATGERLMDAKKIELNHYIDLAHTAIKDILASPDDGSRKQRLVERLNTLRFGDNGYFFAFTGDGEVAGHAKESLIGKNLWGAKSKNGILFIQDLITAAKNGGDYVLYDWPKLNQDGQFMKLSYAIWLPEVEWMIGTGFYLDDVDATLAGMKAEQSKQIKTTIFTTLIVTAIIVVILIVISLLLVNSIVRSLNNITNRLKSIANEGGDLTQRLEVNGNDELGMLSNAFNLFVEKIHTLVKRTAETTHSVNTSAVGSQNLSTTITSSVNNQRVQTDMVARAMNAMSTSAQDVSNNASEAADAANAAHLSCNSAKTVVTNGVQSVKSLVDEIEKASGVINNLRGDVSQIATVLDVIRGIAEQTNLLALNAAIEAARAGEQGRGFAVVADEVRTLASRTQASTQEIQEMIERLQQGSEEAVNVMASSKSVGEETVEHSVSTGLSLDEIAQSVSNINNMNAQIANAAREQSQVGESINENLIQIVAESDVTFKATSESHATASELVDKSNELSGLIQQFKV